MLEQFATYIFIIQLFHSFEELTTGFHKKWYLFTMPFIIFLLFEIIHTIFWGIVIFTDIVPFKSHAMLFFLALMFANGVQHIVWFGQEKRYVPGLITSPFLIIVFLIFLFQTQI